MLGAEKQGFGCEQRVSLSECCVMVRDVQRQRG